MWRTGTSTIELSELGVKGSGVRLLARPTGRLSYARFASS
jgi:hypothetical protein